MYLCGGHCLPPGLSGLADDAYRDLALLLNDVTEGHDPWANVDLRVMGSGGAHWQVLDLELHDEYLYVEIFQIMN